MTEFQPIEDTDAIALPTTSDPQRTKGWDVKGKEMLIALAVAVLVLLGSALFFLIPPARSPTPAALPPILPTQSVVAAESESRFDAIEQTLEALKNQPPPVVDHTAGLETLTAVIDQLAESVVLRAQESAALLTRIIAVEKALAQPPPPSEKVAAERASLSLLSVAPPFRLLSVEVWGNTPVALLALSGRTRAVGAGEFVAAWKVIAVDNLSQTVRVAPKHDMRQEQVIEAGA